MKYDLNEAQKKAVYHDTGPLLLVAGAGTGKTTVITERVSELIRLKKAQTNEILALTFTEKAAGEMEERIDEALPYGYVDLWVSTFHAFCEKILEAHGLDIGLPANFKLYDQTQQWILLHNNFDKLNLDYYRPMGNPTKFIRSLLTHFSRLKDEAIWPEEYLAYAESLKLNADSSHFISQILSKDEQDALSSAEIKELASAEIQKVQEVAHAYHVYQQLLLDNSGIDFGDLINYTLRLFSKRKKVLAKYRAQFKYILVDEFQDTNWSQYELIKLLAAPKNNLTVVGDDDQSIYKFRGASVSNILQFKKDYPKTEQILLVKNYRSYQNILDASYMFIQNNNPNRLEVSLKKKKNFSKKLLSQKKGQGTIEHLEFETLEDEMKGVVGKILELKEKDKSLLWSDFAVLVRANSHADIFNYGFERANIPYSFIASRGLYNKAVVLDILSWFRLLDNYHESAALFRVMSIPEFGFTQKEIINFNYWAKRKSRSLYSILMHASTLEGISEETLKRTRKLVSMIEKHTNSVSSRTVREMTLAFLEDSGILQSATKEDTLHAHTTVCYINQFYKKITDFEASGSEFSVRQFLYLMELELQSGEQGSLKTDAQEGPETVKVMTVHAAKGLEFEHVFVVNLVDRRFPTSERKDPIEIPDVLVKEILPTGNVHLQEERRLFYVACTRARTGLFLTSAKDYGGSRAKKPSIFLSEIGAKPFLGKIPVPKKIGEIEYEKGVKQYYKMPERFSFSQLKAYENCPWQYRYSFIFRIPVKGKAVFSFGKTIHLVMQKIFQQVKNKQEVSQGDLFSSGVGKKSNVFGGYISKKEVLDLYQQCFIDDWYAGQKQREEYFNKGIEILKTFYEDTKNSIVKPLHLEKSFTVKIADANAKKEYTLFGVIDRVDEDGDGIEIIDYKTGLPKKKLNSDDKEQLLIYQLAADDIFVAPVKKLTFHYVNSNEKQSFLGEKKDIEKLKNKIVSVIHDIEKGEFHPTPGFVCQSCDFKEICPFRAV